MLWLGAWLFALLIGVGVILRLNRSLTMVLGGGPEAPVHAAGGIVVRPEAEGTAVLIIHRPKYDDWSFPKGKLDSGESFEQAALREVEEETGYVCELEHEVGSVSYRDRKGRPKLVRYWRMRPVEGGGRFTPNQEVDEIRWVPLDEARRLLTYPHDRDVLVQ